MNFINALKKWLFNIFEPYLECMPYTKDNKKKKKDLSQDQRFRDLFKKRKSSLILSFFFSGLIIFGIGQSFSFIAFLIACSPFVVLFWGSFGEQIMSLIRFKKK